MWAPPKQTMSSPPASFNSTISSSTGRAERRAFDQSNSGAVWEKTSFGSELIRRAIGLSELLQTSAISS